MIFVQIAGFLGADAEERYTATGKRVVVLRVAVRARQGGGGKRDDQKGRDDRGDDTIWWRVNIWSDRFDKMLPYLRKGAAVVICGEMNKPESYVSKDGVTQVSLSMTAEIVKFSPFGKPAERVSHEREPVMQTKVQEEYATFGAGVKDTSFESEAIGDDDLPF